MDGIETLARRPEPARGELYAHLETRAHEARRYQQHLSAAVWRLDMALRDVRTGASPGQVEAALYRASLAETEVEEVLRWRPAR